MVYGLNQMDIKKRLRRGIDLKSQSPLVDIKGPVLADEVETSFRGICVREPFSRMIAAMDLIKN
jgi:hypothetical protein